MDYIFFVKLQLTLILTLVYGYVRLSIHTFNGDHDFLIQLLKNSL